MKTRIKLNSSIEATQWPENIMPKLSDISRPVAPEPAYFTIYWYVQQDLQWWQPRQIPITGILFDGHRAPNFFCWIKLLASKSIFLCIPGWTIHTWIENCTCYINTWSPSCNTSTPTLVDRQSLLDLSTFSQHPWKIMRIHMISSKFLVTKCSIPTGYDGSDDGGRSV